MLDYANFAAAGPAGTAAGEQIFGPAMPAHCNGGSETAAAVRQQDGQAVRPGALPAVCAPGAH